MERHARDQRDFGALHWREWYAEYDRLPRGGGAADRRRAGRDRDPEEHLRGVLVRRRGLAVARGRQRRHHRLEFPSNSTPWKTLEARGVEMRVVASRDGAFAPDDIEPLIDDRTRIVTVSSVAFHNGFAADLDAIGEICARRGVLFCVDAIQSRRRAADRRPPLEDRVPRRRRPQVDLRPGRGGDLLRRRGASRASSMSSRTAGRTSTATESSSTAPTDLLPDARRFEAGSLNTNGIYGLRAAIDLLLEVGIEAIAARRIALATRLARRLESIGWRVGVAASDPFRHRRRDSTRCRDRRLLRLHRAARRGGHRLRAARGYAALLAALLQRRRRGRPRRSMLLRALSSTMTSMLITIRVVMLRDRAAGRRRSSGGWWRARKRRALARSATSRAERERARRGRGARRRLDEAQQARVAAETRAELERSRTSRHTFVALAQRAFQQVGESLVQHEQDAGRRLARHEEGRDRDAAQAAARDARSVPRRADEERAHARSRPTADCRSRSARC